MRHPLHPRSLPCLPRLMAWAVACLLACGVAHAAQPVGRAQRVDPATGSASEPRIAGEAGRFAIAWFVHEGPEAGVYLRRAGHAVWGPSQRLATPGQSQWRDLQLALDAAGRVLLAWTAQQAGAGRVLFAAAQSDAALPPAMRAIAREADFPALRVEGGGPALLAWQQGPGLKPTIEALWLRPDATTEALGRVSGATPGLNPQILGTSPPVVAWYALAQLGTPLRFSEWRASQWMPGHLGEEPLRFPAPGQMLLGLDRQALTGVWPLEGPGAAGLGVGRQPVVTNAQGIYPGTAVTSETLTRPQGDAGQATLGGSASGRQTVAWRVFLGSSQRICIATVLEPGRRRLLIASPPDQPHASQPDHTTAGDWSGVVWANPLADGGDGGIYFADVQWREK